MLRTAINKIIDRCDCTKECLSLSAMAWCLHEYNIEPIQCRSRAEHKLGTGIGLQMAEGSAAADNTGRHLFMIATVAIKKIEYDLAKQIRYTNMVTNITTSPNNNNNEPKQFYSWTTLYHNLSNFPIQPLLRYIGLLYFILTLLCFHDSG